MDSKEEDIRYRGEEKAETTTEEDKTVPTKVVGTKHVNSSKEKYNVEKDPKYRCLFIMLKVIIVILALICFAIIFFNWIAPLIVPTEHKIDYLRQRLINTMCEGECSEKDIEDIENIIKRVRNEM